MPDHDHSTVINQLVYELLTYCATNTKECFIYTESDVYISKRSDEHRHTSPAAASPEPASTSSASSSDGPSSLSSTDNNRRPDISVYDYRIEDCDGDRRPPILVVEVTSTEKSRHQDLHAKWRAYCRSNVPEYVIVDRDLDRKGTASHRPCVIVGSTQASWPRSSTGDPNESPNSPNTRSKGGKSAVANSKYGRKVFQGDDLVCCSFFSLTANQILRPATLVGLETAKRIQAEATERERVQEMNDLRAEIKRRRKENEELKNEIEELRRRLGQ